MPDPCLIFYNDKGKNWLDELPALVSQIASKLQLRDLKKLSNLSYHTVMSGFQGNNPIILKLGLDGDALKQEALALKCFADCGAVKVLVAEEGMLLLERAIPGTSLKCYFPDKESGSLDIACQIIKKLHRGNLSNTHHFPHLKEWLAALDGDLKIPLQILQKARELRDQLLESAGPDRLLHGDLHHDNILQNGDDWVVIDPKGVMGELAYEVTAFIRNPMPELLRMPNAAEIIQNRIAVFSDMLNIPKTRITDWCFVQGVLSWVWALEDGCNTSYFEQFMYLIM